MFILDKDSGELKLIKINKQIKKGKMKIVTVAFMLLFNYLDTLPKLFHNVKGYKSVLLEYHLTFRLEIDMRQLQSVSNQSFKS